MSSRLQLNKVIEDEIEIGNLEKIFLHNSEEHCDSRDSEDLEYGINPFPHCVVKNFLSQPQHVEALQSEILKFDYLDKNNDLYKFKQTKALERRQEKNISRFKKSLEAVREWLSVILSVKLGEKIDMFAAKYNYTDTLLCHDDELEGRRVAYIYYLVPDNWSKQDGGSLDLFSMDADTRLPTTVKKSITPTRNSFAFFEVTPQSFHQVAEVLSETKTRLSISGWFHGLAVARKPHAIEPIPKSITPVDVDEDFLYSMINQQYIDPLTQSEIQEKFEEESEIQLADFLPPNMYESLCTDIKSENIKWNKCGPPIKRNVETADVSTLPESVRNCLKLLTSDAMFLIISNMTGLKLHPLAADSDSESDTEAGTSEPKLKKSKSNCEKKGDTADTDATTGQKSGIVTYQVRRWSHGAYTLLHDNDMEQGKDYALDAVIHFNCDDWLEDYGGYISYIAKGDDEELNDIIDHLRIHIPNIGTPTHPEIQVKAAENEPTAGLQFNSGQRWVESVITDVGTKFLDACDRKRRYNAEYYGKTERKKQRTKDKIRVTEEDSYGKKSAKDCDIPVNELEQKMKGYIDKLQSLTDSIQGSKEWLEARRCSLTASNFGSIAKMHATTSPKNTIKSLLYNPFKGNAATAYGLEQEKPSEEDFVDWLVSKGACEISVAHPGLVGVDGERALAASPDGIVCCHPGSTNFPSSFIEHIRPQTIFCGVEVR